MTALVDIRAAFVLKLGQNIYETVPQLESTTGMVDINQMNILADDQSTVWLYGFLSVCQLPLIKLPTLGLAQIR